jgi:hypothetical protein
MRSKYSLPPNADYLHRLDGEAGIAEIAVPGVAKRRARFIRLSWLFLSSMTIITCIIDIESPMPHPLNIEQ